MSMPDSGGRDGGATSLSKAYFGWVATTHGFFVPGPQNVPLTERRDGKSLGHVWMDKTQCKTGDSWSKKRQDWIFAALHPQIKSTWAGHNSASYQTKQCSPKQFREASTTQAVWIHTYRKHYAAGKRVNAFARLSTLEAVVRRPGPLQTTIRS